VPKIKGSLAQRRRLRRVPLHRLLKIWFLFLNQTWSCLKNSRSRARARRRFGL